MKVNELPESENPSNKIRYFGPNNLTNAELLQVITGARNIDTPLDIIAEFDLSGVLQTANHEELEKVKGVTSLMAGKLIAAVELGKRLSSVPARNQPSISSPEDIANIFMEDMRYKTQEHFKIAMLNTRNKIIGIEDISIGNITSSIVDPRDVFKPAIKHGAASIILIYNHPSGNPEPSDADLLVTSRIVDSGELLDTRVLDHIIIGDGRFYSMKKERIDCFRDDYSNSKAAKIKEFRKPEPVKEREER